MIMLPGQEDHSNMYFNQSTTHDYEHLYQLYVLGLADTSNDKQYTVYAEFKEQLQQSPKVWYQT